MSFRITEADRRQALDLILLDTSERLTRDLAELRRSPARASFPLNLIALIEAWRSRIHDLRDDLKHGRIACQADERAHSPPSRSKR